jgi:hypothetical protein
MNRQRFRRKLGTLLAAASIALTSVSCYGFSGGGGFPSDIKTMFIEPFANETVQADLDQMLFRKLQDKVPRALGTRPGTLQNADAVLRGRITRYDDVGQNYQASSATTSGSINVLTYQVTISISAEIVDRRRNVVLWESQAIVGRGEYKRDSEKDLDGRERALNHVIQLIIDGAQSQW